MALSLEQKTLVRSTFVKVALIADKAAELFYNRLFEIEPSVKALFAKTDMTEQGRKLMQIIGTAVSALDRLDDLVPDIQALGKRHVDYGVKESHYTPVGEALLWTLEQGLGADFTPEVKIAWAEVYGVLSRTAIEAAYEKPVGAKPKLPAVPGKLDREHVAAQMQQDKNLIGANMSGLNLNDLDLFGANLTGANLAYSNLSGANLAEANLTGANLTSTDFSNARLIGAKMAGANLTAAHLSACDLSRADLSGAVLTAANLRKAVLEGARLVGTFLICVELSDANMSQANLTGAVLTGANLTRANLKDATLRGANLTVAIMTDVNLEGAKLVGVVGLER